MVESAPIFYAIAQMRFGLVPAIANKIADINGHLRNLGFQDFDRVVGQRLNIMPNEEGVPGVQADESVTWVFGNKTSNANILLTEDSIAIQTLSYSGHGSLFAPLLDAAAFIADIMELEGFSRIGFRVLNSLGPSEEGTSARNFLAPGLLGVELANLRIHAVFEQAYTSQIRVLGSTAFVVARTIASQSSKAFPPDLVPMGLQVSGAIEGKSPLEFVLLDLDHYAELAQPLGVASASDVLEELHSGTKKVLAAHLNDKGRSRWNF